MEHVVVVGSSLAGLRACEVLRSGGFAGAITVVGAERHLPYDRPPLSKKFLAGEWDVDQIALRKPDALGELQLTFRLGAGATALDTARRTITLAEGMTVKDLADKLDLRVKDVLAKLLMKRLMVTINSTLDTETATMLFNNPGPRAAAISTASNSAGKARKTSVTRISASSTQPPK